MESPEDIDEALAELLQIFSSQIEIDEHHIIIDPLQKNTQLLRQNVQGFVDRYKSSAPQINQLSDFINGLKDGEYFYLFPNKHQETIEIVELGIQLYALNKDLDVKTTQEVINEIFGDMLSNYDMLAFNGECRSNIGEPQKLKRKCRFCGGNAPKTTFRKKAHAISEALGNKGIVCNEECDLCNEKFGSNIETDLIAFLSLSRAFSGIKGKGSGAPKLKGKNFAVKKEASGEVNFSLFSEGGDLPKQIEAHTYDKVSQQNIYRALCKYVISVIPSEHLPMLTKCVDWINCDSVVDQLPPVHFRVVNELHSEYPSLYVYIRKNSDYEIPHLVGEFRFANILILFICPASSNDTNLFLNVSDLNKFWEMSHFFKTVPQSDWRKLSLNSDEKKELRFVINLVN